MIGRKIQPIIEHHIERPLSILLMPKHFDNITFIGKSGALITSNNICCGNTKFYCWRRTFYKCNDNVCDTGKTVGPYKDGFQMRILWPPCEYLFETYISAYAMQFETDEMFSDTVTYKFGSCIYLGWSMVS